MTIDTPKSSHVPALRRLMRSAFGESEEFLDKFFTVAFSPERARVALEGDEIVAALYWFDCEYLGLRTAYLYAIATDAAHRGRGFGSLLVLDTVKHLSSLGYSSVLLVPANQSLFGFYEKLGFKKACGIKEFSAVASGENISISEISKEAYSEKRASLIPVGAVIEEDDILSLLEGDLKFYTGEDFLLLARQNGEQLIVAELLGNTKKAPDILSSLGCKAGLFRTVGFGRDFTMYLPLTAKSVPPTYFGIALDI